MNISRGNKQTFFYNKYRMFLIYKRSNRNILRLFFPKDRSSLQLSPQSHRYQFFLQKYESLWKFCFVQTR